MDMFLTNLWHVEEDFSGLVIVRLQSQLQLCLSFASLRDSVSLRELLSSRLEKTSALRLCFDLTSLWE